MCIPHVFLRLQRRQGEKEKKKFCASQGFGIAEKNSASNALGLASDRSSQRSHCWRSLFQETFKFCFKKTFFFVINFVVQLQVVFERLYRIYAIVNNIAPLKGQSDNGMHNLKCVSLNNGIKFYQLFI